MLRHWLIFIIIWISIRVWMMIFKQVWTRLVIVLRLIRILGFQNQASPRIQTFKIRLENKSRGGTPLHQNLECSTINQTIDHRLPAECCSGSYWDMVEWKVLLLNVVYVRWLKDNKCLNLNLDDFIFLSDNSNNYNTFYRLCCIIVKIYWTFIFIHFYSSF